MVGERRYRIYWVICFRRTQRYLSLQGQNVPCHIAHITTMCMFFCKHVLTQHPQLHLRFTLHNAVASCPSFITSASGRH